MKRFTEVVLMLCIALMCTTPFEAQGQHRRSGGSSRSTRTEQHARSGRSEPRTKMAASRSHSRETRSSVSRSDHRSSRPSMDRQRNSRPSSSRSSVNRQHNSRPSASRLSMNRPGSNRSSMTRPGNSRSSVKGPGNNRPNVNRPNGNRPNVNRPHNSRPNVNRPDSRAHNPRPAVTRAPRDRHMANVRPPRDRRPAAVRPRDARAFRHGIGRPRPYLEPRHRPRPYYRYGNHFFGHRLRYLPHGYVRMRIGHRDYYYYDGIYYRPYLFGGYYICRPPLGTRFAATMFNAAMTAIAINTLYNEIDRARRAAELSSLYAAVSDAYAIRTSNDYYETNLINQAGRDYYYQDGVFYILEDGQYAVVEPPIGAIVTGIPSDYEEVELDGTVYYQVEDTLYKPSVIDGTLCYEVACNL